MRQPRSIPSTEECRCRFDRTGGIPLPLPTADPRAIYYQASAEDRFHDHCGIFGICGHQNASRLTYLGLYALQHRGQESAGICSSDLKQLHYKTGMGHVSDVFNDAIPTLLPGTMAIGHVRYSTAGESQLHNAQPLVMDTRHGTVAVCHNGNIANAASLRLKLKNEHATFRSTSDTEIILQLLARASGDRLEDALVQVLPVLEGAYSLLLLTADRLIAVKDPAAFRPLCIGCLGSSFVFSSETCAFDLIGAEYVREVGPGEIVSCDQNGIQIRHALPAPRTSHCIFEHVYFSRPDSQVFAQSVYLARRAFGRQLARESPVEADVVVPVPDSGVTAAIGYAAESGIPFDFGLTRNHYIGRTFIEPHQAIRQFGVRVKLNPVRHILQGRRVVLIDDSIVRGTTSRKIVNMIRSVGATEIHLRISSPQILSPCFYGIDTPTRQELIAARKSLDEIANFVRADSVRYLSLNGLLSAVGDPEGLRYCTACFTGKYPIVTEEMIRSLNIQENPVT